MFLLRHPLLCFLALVAASLACGSARAQFASTPSCPSPSWSITSGTPATISTPTAAGTVHSGVLQFDSGNCSVPGPLPVGNYINVYSSFTTTSAATAVSGISVVATGAPTGSLLVGSGTCTLSVNATLNQVTLVNNVTPWFGFATCRFTASFPFAFTKAAGAVSGTLPATTLLAANGPNSGTTAWGSWNVYLVGSTTGNPGWSPAFVVSANTCTVSTPSVAVSLPNVSRTSLASAGATAGIAPFTLSFSGCSTSASGFTGTQTWAFTPGPASNVISNTGTATNVYAQILDSSMAPITNGGTTSFSVPAAGGAVSQQFYARYYSSGTAGAGTLNSTATFTMTYN